MNLWILGELEIEYLCEKYKGFKIEKYLKNKMLSIYN